MAATETKAPPNGTATNGTGKAAGIYEALVLAQMEMPAVERDGVNPHYKSKFTTLGNLIATVKPVLNKHGLAFAQFPSQDDQGRPTLLTIIFHESGEKLEFEALLLLAKDDPQGQGSAITYMRRYALASALGISDQDDDDGNVGSAPAPKGKPRAKAKAKPSARPVTAAQQGKLNALFGAAELSAEQAKALVLWTSGQPIQDRLSSKQASALINALGDDGAGAPDLLQKLQDAAEEGDETVQKAWVIAGGGENA